MMGLSDGRKSFPIGLTVLIQYRSVTDTQPARQPPSHVAVAITLNAQASSLKTAYFKTKMQHLRLRIAHAVTLLPTGGIAFVKHACRCLVWEGREAGYPLLSKIALDLISAPAS